MPSDHERYPGRRDRGPHPGGPRKGRGPVDVRPHRSALRPAEPAALGRHRHPVAQGARSTLLGLAAEARVLDLCTGHRRPADRSAAARARASRAWASTSRAAMLVRGASEARARGPRGARRPRRAATASGCPCADARLRRGPRLLRHPQHRRLRRGPARAAPRAAARGAPRHPRVLDAAGAARPALPLLFRPRPAPDRRPGERRRGGLRVPARLRRALPGARGVGRAHAAGGFARVPGAR